MKRRSGFTLIELMIVLAIVAALAAILTPMGLNALNRAQATQYIADIRNIKSAQQMYYFDKRVTADISTATPNALEGYLDVNELTVGGIDVYTAAASENEVTVTAVVTSEGVKEQFELAWKDRSATVDYTQDDKIVLTFSF